MSLPRQCLSLSLSLNDFDLIAKFHKLAFGISVWYHDFNGDYQTPGNATTDDKAVDDG